MANFLREKKLATKRTTPEVYLGSLHKVQRFKHEQRKLGFQFFVDMLNRLLFVLIGVAQLIAFFCTICRMIVEHNHNLEETLVQLEEEQRLDNSYYKILTHGNCTEN